MENEAPPLGRRKHFLSLETNEEGNSTSIIFLTSDDLKHAGRVTFVVPDLIWIYPRHKNTKKHCVVLSKNTYSRASML